MPDLVPGIDRSPEKQGGEPCVAGTRVPVRRIGHLATEQELDVDEIAERFDISLSDVHRALAYYYDHPDEMARYDQRERVAERQTEETETFDEATERLLGGP